MIDTHAEALTTAWQFKPSISIRPRDAELKPIHGDIRNIWASRMQDGPHEITISPDSSRASIVASVTQRVKKWANGNDLEGICSPICEQTEPLTLVACNLYSKVVHLGLLARLNGDGDQRWIVCAGVRCRRFGQAVAACTARTRGKPVHRFCVILSGMLPDYSGKPEAWNAVVSSAYGHSDDEFRQRVHARMPLIVKRDLDEQSAELMCRSLCSLGAVAIVRADNGQTVYLQRNAQTLGPLPLASVSDFAQLGDSYRLQEEVEWRRWSRAVAVTASLPLDAYDTQIPFVTTSDATPPWLDEPPPVPHAATAHSTSSNPFGDQSEVEPPPFLIQPPPVTRATSTPLQQRAITAKTSNNAWGGLAVVIGVVVIGALAAFGAYSYLHSSALAPPASTAVASMSPSRTTSSQPSGAVPTQQTPAAPVAAAAPASTTSNPAVGVHAASSPATTTSPIIAHVSSVKPSFDCTQAQTSTEQAICASDDLSRLDSQMAQIYRHTMATLPSDQLASLKASQRQWLELRANQCGADVSCIQTSLQTRIDELQQLRQEAQDTAQRQASGEAQGKLEAASECYRNANYDCAIQIAQSLLSQNPNDARAQDLLQRSQQAQNQALHSNWNIH